METVKLVGGTRDGDLVTADGWQRVYVSTIRLSFQQSLELVIDDVQCWRWPDEFYKRERAGEDFIFERRVDYKPVVTSVTTDESQRTPVEN